MTEAEIRELVREQIERVGREVLPPLRRALAGLVTSPVV